MSETEERKAQDVGQDEAWATNMKRTYDEYQHESLESIRRNRSYVDKVLSDAQSLTAQCMQNAIETANLNGKQAVRHADIAIDRQWNVDEQAWAVQKILQDKVFVDAIAAMVAKIVADAAE